MRNEKQREAPAHNRTNKLKEGEKTKQHTQRNKQEVSSRGRTDYNEASIEQFKDNSCIHCKALLFAGEINKNRSGQCCHNGKVKLNPLKSIL